MGYCHGTFIRDMNALTATERRLLHVYASHPDKNFSEIAQIMDLAPKSVAKYAQQIREKLYVG